MRKCNVCEKLTDRPKYCSHACQGKGWKIRDREKYLDGKRRYRRKNKEKILAYNKWYRKLGMRPLHSPRKRKIIVSRGGICQRCGCNEKLNVHHIKPPKFGGTNNTNNLLVLCWDCHMAWEKKMKGFWIK